MLGSQTAMTKFPLKLFFRLYFLILKKEISSSMCDSTTVLSTKENPYLEN